MKKLFLMLTVMMASTVMMAQWVKPEWPLKYTPAFSEAAIDDEESVQYLYNVECEAFMLGANDWGTRASVSKFSGNKVRLVTMETNLRLSNYVEAKGGWAAAVDCDGGLSAWVDGQGRAGDGMWSIEAIDGNMYRLHNEQAKNAAGELLSWGVKKSMADTRTYFNENDEEYGNKWAFVSEEEYGKFLEEVANVQDQLNAYDSLLNKYNTAVELKALLDKIAAETKLTAEAQKAVYDNGESTLKELTAAKDSLNKVYNAFTALKNAIEETESKYPGIDLSAQKAVLNSDATVAAMNESKNQIPDVIVAYLAGKEGSVGNPLDITETLTQLLPANDTDLNKYWTRVFTGNGTVGTFHMNTWSVEGNPGNDGTNMVTPFIEDWVGKGTILSDQKYYRNAVKVKPGVYKILANVRIYNESTGATQNEGAYLIGNNSRTALLGQENSVQDYYNGMLYYWNENFETYTIVGADSLLTFGIQIENANFNWVAAKNFRVLDLGNSQEAYDLVRENTELITPEIDEDVLGTKSLLEAYREAYQNYQTATDAKAISEGYSAIAVLADSVMANIKAYADYSAIVKEYNDSLSAGAYESLNGDLWDEFVDMIQSEEEVTILPGELTTPEIIAKGEEIKKLFDTAIKASISEGDDVTRLIANASFADGFNGWTKPGAGNVGNFSTLEPKVPNNVEVYENTVEIYQEIEGVPDGVYSLSVNAFERPAGNGNYTGEEDAKVFLYMNEFQTPVQNIVKDAIPVEEAEHLVNSYFDAENKYPSSAAGWDLMDYNFNEAYVPNGMVGAAVAFNADRYKQTVYGYVKGGKMKIGLTSNGVKAHWVLWSNFKLTYEGNKFSLILEPYIAEAESYLEKNEFNITNDAVEALKEAISDAEAASSNEEAEAALESLNAALIAARENANVVAKISGVVTKLEELGEKTDEMESDELTAKVDDLLEYFSDEDTYLFDTAEGIQAKIAEADALEKEVNEAYTAWKLEEAYQLLAEEVEGASDDDPIDVTEYALVNPALSTGNIDGWTLDLTTYTNKGYQANTIYSADTVCVLMNGVEYTAQCNQFIEVWRSGNAPILGDIYQSIMLPAGTYVLGADIIAVNQGDAATPVEGCYLYAGETHMPVASGNGKPAHFDLIFKVAEDKTVLNIGINCSETTLANWLAADNFTLTAYGKDSKLDENGEENAIESIAAQTQKAIYTITGVRMNKALKPGLYIINGKKMLVK